MFRQAGFTFLSISKPDKILGSRFFDQPSMFISEIYHSLQGEGFLTGTPSVLVRTSGCNLRCGFCDTPFASWNPEGERLSVNEIVQAIRQQTLASLPPMQLPDAPDKDFSIAGSALPDLHSRAGTDAQAPAHTETTRHVILTGGEPMMQREITELCAALHLKKFHITMETAGTIERELDCDLMSISPKLSNSDPQASRAGEWLEKHRQARHRPEVVRQLIQRHAYQLKFVVSQPSDLDEILAYLDAVKEFDPSRVLLMPEGIKLDELEQREQWLGPLSEQHGFKLCRRLHIAWYGNLRRT